MKKKINDTCCGNKIRLLRARFLLCCGSIHQGLVSNSAASYTVFCQEEIPIILAGQLFRGNPPVYRIPYVPFDLTVCFSDLRGDPIKRSILSVGL